MTLTLATWNVNSIKARLPNALDWLAEAKPDIVCLQEIKTVDEGFPREEIERLGYNVITHGQKTYNGVAILSKFPIEESLPGLPGEEEDEQARYLEAVISAPNGPIRVASIYLPNGNPAPGPKYDYKLAWMDRLARHAADLLKLEEPLILAGDYNVSRAAFDRLKWLGLTEAFEQLDGRAHQYTFYDYQAGRWNKGQGIRIDHLLCSPQAADHLESIEIHKATRGEPKASDHIPILGIFSL